MPGKTLVQGASKHHHTKAEKAARSAAEEPWRRGNLTDYEPINLSDDGYTIFESLALAIPDEVLTTVDGYTLETAADAIDRMRKCRALIDAEGMVVTSTNGNGFTTQKANEHIAIYNKYSEIAKRWLVELGLTPSARGKIASDAAAAALKPKGLRQILEDDDG